MKTNVTPTILDTACNFYSQLFAMAEGTDDTVWLVEAFFSSPILHFLKDTPPVTVERELIVADEPHAPLPTEFASVSDKELQSLRDKNRNKNTEKSTATWVNRFQQWQQVKGVSVNLPDISPKDLDNILQQYFAELRTQKGDEYEPDSLRTMLGTLHRYIKGTGYCHSILSADEFAGSREVLNGKAMTLREKGKGKRKRKADCLTAEEEEAMWQSGVLGYSTPQSLNFTVF